MDVVTNLTSLEAAVAAQSRKERTETAILGSLALVGMASIAVLAPNAAGVLSKMVPEVLPRSQQQSVSRAIGRLIKNGYIKKQKDNRYHLTDEGVARLQRLMVRSMRAVPSKKRWDKKWRIVVFDIKETRHGVRDDLRRMLITTGFVKLQHSVWVYPYRCDEVVALLKFHLTLGWDLVYIIADAIEGDDELRKHFQLPQ